MSGILGMEVAVASIAAATDQILAWAGHGESRSVCVANVHMCMEAFDDPSFQQLVNAADLTVADGRPLVWAQRLLGYGAAEQVRGTDLTLALCRAAEHAGIPVGFYGAAPECLQDLQRFLGRTFPRLTIVCAISPPFRPLTAEEEAADAEAITRSGARILLVGLGCPKQEKWMAAHRAAVTPHASRRTPPLPCVMVGVGAAFDFLSGTKKDAPRWLQRLGLEWLFRFCCEPRRLWRRYLMHNPRFVWHFLRQLARKERTCR